MYSFSVHHALVVLLYFYSFTIVDAAEAYSRNSSSPGFAKPPAFLLGGDSTTQTKSGWGDAFLSLVQRPATGKNFGRGGRTTISYKTDGSMAQLLAEVAKDAAQYSVFATLQFGHNDQNKGTGITPASFEKNLMGLAREIKAAGGIPLLITPLSRTKFKDGKFSDTLAEWRTATIAAAKAGSYSYIDLNQASSRYIKAIGQQASSRYSPDTTHLNDKGAQVFARIVADLMLEKYPDFKQYLKADSAMSAAIKNGKPI